MELIVGRKGEQKTPITESTVSGKHLKITDIGGGMYKIEDLGSTNGTFVNGVQVSKKSVPGDTVVWLGEKYSFVVRDMMAAGKNTNNAAGGGGGSQGGGQQAEEITAAEQEHLEQLWEEFNTEKVRLQKKNAQKGFMRMLPMMIIGPLGAICSIVKGLEDARLYIIIGAVVLGVILTMVAFNSTSGLPEKMAELQNDFQIRYVCPRCKNFLGFQPFQALKNRGKCGACKAKFQ